MQSYYFVDLRRLRLDDVDVCVEPPHQLRGVKFCPNRQ